MKTIYFIRHAKSSWEDMSLDDFDRPLNKRGKRDAPFMAQLLKGKGIKVDALVSSPANRAQTTAKHFADAFNIEHDGIHLKPQIYEAYQNDVLEVIYDFPQEWETVLIFGHNPTFTSLANMFSKDYIPNVPTCGIVKVISSSTLWSDLNRQNAVVAAFMYPKQYF